MTRSVSPVPPPRLDLAALPPADRQSAIDAAAGRHPSGRHQARKIAPSAAPTRCHACGHVDSTVDQGQAMDRHVDRHHAGAGGSSMVLP
jgi:hypothetical protein